MTEHLYSRFSDHIEMIQARLEEDGTFEQICVDYEEACTWLALRCQTEGSSKECDRARELIKSLEQEITKALEIEE